MAVKLQIACCNLPSVLNAEAFGADNIELFENIAEGGCTPSFGMIQRAQQLCKLPIHVMLRPRGGHFIYSTHELDIMLQDLEMCKQLQVSGIVFGVLHENGTIHTEACQQLLAAKGHLEATFHRAIDCTPNIFSSVHTLTELGFNTVLTSGGAPEVMGGLDNIQQLQQQFGTLITIMPGAGVTPENAEYVVRHCGVPAIHATCKSLVSQDHAPFKNMSDYWVSEGTCVAAIKQSLLGL